jgi:hypothetical protein
MTEPILRPAAKLFLGVLVLVCALMTAATALGSPPPGPGPADPFESPARGAGTALPGACASFLADNGATQRRVLAYSAYATYTGQTFTGLACGSDSVSVPPGAHALVTVRVDGTVECGGSNGGFCLGKVLINGAEGRPLTLANHGFDVWAYTNSATPAIVHSAFSRTAVVSCARRHHGPCTYTFTVQAAGRTPQTMMLIGHTTVDAEVTYY